MGVAYQLLQGCAILLLPLFGFTLQEYWVFPATVGPRRALRRKNQR